MPAVQDDSQRDRRTTKRILAIGLPLVVIAGTGIGYAYWTSTGTGTGTATGGTAASVTLSVGAASGTLSPGNFVTMPVTAVNSSNSALSVSTLSFGSVTAGSACDAVSGITATDVVLTQPASTPVVVPAKSGGVNGTAPFGSVKLTLPETGANQNACQGATFTVVVNAS